MTPLLVKIIVLVVALLSVSVGAWAAADSTWKTHQDQNCGIELKYPTSYVLESSGRRDACEPLINIGVRDARRLRALFSLEIREMESSARPPLSARGFALQVAMAQCTADGADSSTSCTNGEIRSPFRTARGFRGFEILLTEIQETYSPSKIETRRRGPIFALDLSDDEVVRVLMADCEPERFGELKAILDTIRVWTRARRPTPRVVEMNPFFRGAPQALALRVTTDEQYRASRWPPGPVTSWLLTDPRGRRLGRDPATSTWYSEAPAVTHSTAIESGFVLRESIEGRYELQITASVPSVPYQVAVQAPDQASRPATAGYAGRSAEPGAVDRYEIAYSPGSTPPMKITEVGDSWRFRILLSSRGNVASVLILTDPQGRQTGRDPLAKLEHRTIPLAAYVDGGIGPRTILLDLRQPTDGSYILQVTGIAPGTYTLDLRAWDRNGTATARPELRNVPTEPGVVHLYRLDYSSTDRTPLKLAGRFEGDRLLAYANPAGTEARLRAGATSFPLVIFYSARIRPVTFNALLNGDNISGRFTPEPEGYQIVRIPLAPGPNRLVLSVEGLTESGQTTTDTHNLLFRVE